MNDIWFISDTHFKHANILKFTNYDGDPVRPGFKDVDEMDEFMIQRWNDVVKPHDKIYHLGDVIFGKNETAADVLLGRLNGKKRLILGNHDNYFPISLYAKHFEKILVQWRPSTEVIFSHYPLHIGVDDPKIKKNVHGHVHRTRNEISEKHINISVEMTDYAPIHYDEVLKKTGLPQWSKM